MQDVNKFQGFDKVAENTYVRCLYNKGWKRDLLKKFIDGCVTHILVFIPSSDTFIYAGDLSMGSLLKFANRNDVVFLEVIKGDKRKTQ